MRIAIFFGLFFLVMGALNFYIYRRFFKRLSPGLRGFGPVIPAVLMLGETLFIFDNAYHFLPESILLYLTNAAFIGFTFMLFVVATIYDLTVTASSRVPFDRERRRFVKLVFDATMLVAAAAYLLRGLAQGLKPPNLNKVRVPMKDVTLPGFSLVQISDVHVGRTIKRDFVENLVRVTNELDPGIVVITGDLVDLPIERIRDDLRPLENIKAPTYFSLGNHEYFHGPHEAIAYIRTLGIQPLLNECVQIEHQNQRFNLVGINDVIGQRMGTLPADADAAFAGADPDLPTIVMSHQPKSLKLVENKRCDLMLSGHTHGGQIFPFGYLVMIDQPYLAGLHYHGNGQQIFVSRGAGYWGPPLRFLAPSEITHVSIEPV